MRGVGWLHPFSLQVFLPVRGGIPSPYPVLCTGVGGCNGFHTVWILNSPRTFGVRLCVRWDGYVGGLGLAPVQAHFHMAPVPATICYQTTLALNPTCCKYMLIV